MLSSSHTPEEKLRDLKWLVDNRSLNQHATPRLYSLLITHKSKFNASQWRRSALQKLLGIAFSLWRAVFLTDLKKTRESMMTDVEAFMLEIIETNTITFQQDRMRKDWTFRYYIHNATDRLSQLQRDFEKKGRWFELPGTSRGKSPQQRWNEHQTALEDAIDALESIITGSPPPKVPPKKI